MPSVLQLVSQSAFTAVQPADLMQHLNITDQTQTAYLQSLIDAARVYCERWTGLDFTTSTWNLILDQFPVWANNNWMDRYGNYVYTYPWTNEFAVGRTIQVWQRIDLKRGPLQAVNTIQYYDTSNTHQTITQNDATYGWAYVTPTYLPGFVEPVLYWPIAYPRPDAVTINFTTGFTTLPPQCVHAIKLLCGLWYSLREDISYGPQTVSGATGQAVECLLGTIKPGIYA